MNNITKTVLEKAGEKIFKNGSIGSSGVGEIAYHPLNFEKEMYPFHIPKKLNYKYKDFHPNLNEDTLESHHKQYHKDLVDMLNGAL